MSAIGYVTREGNGFKGELRTLSIRNLARGGAARFGRHGPGFSGSRIGRGAGVGRVLAERGNRSAYGARRVILKASIVKLAGKWAGAAAAHLHYLGRDGTTRDGQRAQFYVGDVVPHQMHVVAPETIRESVAENLDWIEAVADFLVHRRVATGLVTDIRILTRDGLESRAAKRRVFDSFLAGRPETGTEIDHFKWLLREGRRLAD